MRLASFPPSIPLGKLRIGGGSFCACFVGYHRGRLRPARGRGAASADVNLTPASYAAVKGLRGRVGRRRLAPIVCLARVREGARLQARSAGE
jgi:hypothetical protein